MPRAVRFFDEYPPLVLTKRELVCLLPIKDPAGYLLDKLDRDTKWNCPTPTVDGKVICPVPLVEDGDAIQAIQIECDMSGGEGGWSAKALPGPTRDWPYALLQLLRFIRSCKGQIQAEDIAEMQKEKPEDADND